MLRPINLLCALALGVVAAACGDRPADKKPDVTSADVIAGTAQSYDEYVSAEGKFAVSFPAVWKGNYTAVPHADTAFGSRFILEFRFKPDPAAKVPPQTLLAIRVFTPAAWAKASARPGQTIGVKVQARDNDVYVLSLAGSNPYPPGSPSATLFDKMMLAVMQDPAPLRVTPR